MTDLLAAAEMKHAERRNLLGLALQKARADLHLREFVMWVFNATHGGVDGHLKKTYKELSYAPWGLCCSPSKARSTAIKGTAKGLVISTEDRYATGGQSGNLYQIDWDGIRAGLGFSLSCENGKPSESRVVDHGRVEPTPDVETEPRPAAFTGQGGMLRRQPPDSTRQGGMLREQPCNRNSPLHSPLNSNRTGTGTGRAASTAQPVDLALEAETGTVAIALPGPSPLELDFQKIEGIRLDDWPELVAMLDRPVHAMPATHVSAGIAFRFFKADHFKRKSPRYDAALELVGRDAVIRWFREQLALPTPVFPGNVAYLALVLAAAEDASQKADRDIKASRVRYFINTISRGYWQRCVYCLPNVVELLREFDGPAINQKPIKA